MREAKDLTKTSAANMAAIFGVREDAYSLAPPPLSLSPVDTKRMTTSSGEGDNGGAISEREKRRKDKKRYDDNGPSSGAAKKKEKRERASG